jgi:hypothetical protein
MPAKKRIAIFLDGTWNSGETNTNIRPLGSLCVEEDANGVRRLPYYDEGVGWQRREWLRGGVFGSGLDTNVLKPTGGWSRTATLTTTSSSSASAAAPLPPESSRRSLHAAASFAREQQNSTWKFSIPIT